MRFITIVFAVIFAGLVSLAHAQLDMELAKKKCADLGFKSGTERFGACVLQLSKPEEVKRRCTGFCVNGFSV